MRVREKHGIRMVLLHACRFRDEGFMIGAVSLLCNCNNRGKTGRSALSLDKIIK